MARTKGEGGEELPIFSSRQPIVGWRGWNVIHPHYLTNSSVVWTPGERTEAICTARYHPPDEVSPVEGCSCGVYAFNAPFEVKQQGYNSQTLLGEVYLWGKVLEHARGYKAQYAYPKRFYAKTRHLFESEATTTISRVQTHDRDHRWKVYEDLVMTIAARYQVELEFIDETHAIYIQTPAEQQAVAQRQKLIRMQIAQERAAKRKKNDAMKAAAMLLPPTVKDRGYKTLWDQIIAEADEAVRAKLEGKRRI